MFTDSMITELWQKEHVLFQLARLCGVTKDTLLKTLKLRNTKRTGGEVLVDHQQTHTNLRFWYKLFRKISGKKQRLLCNPEISLRQIQMNLKQHLEKIPVSLAATGGKIGDSAIKNAELHKENRYLITMDIKDAYPSINTSRVYKNTQGALMRALDIRCPTLVDPIHKDLCIRAITHLCMRENELPQGATTSTQLINIVMASLDGEIEKKLLEVLGESFVYTRYIDDISISFPHYPTFPQLQNLMENYRRELEKLVSQRATTHILELCQRFSTEKLFISDGYELTHLEKCINNLITLCKKTTWKNEILTHQAVGVLHGYKKQIVYIPYTIKNLRDEIIKVIWSKWWKINPDKTKLYTPQTNTLREITKISYTHDGKRGVGKHTKRAIQRFFTDMGTENPSILQKNFLYKEFFRWGEFETTYSDHERILRWLMGRYRYLEQVYGIWKVPKNLDESYQAAVQRREAAHGWPIVIASLPGDDTDSKPPIDDDLPF